MDAYISPDLPRADSAGRGGIFSDKDFGAIGPRAIRHPGNKITNPELPTDDHSFIRATGELRDMNFDDTMKQGAA